MWNKSNNFRDERIDFLLQHLRNNISKNKRVDANHMLIAKKFNEEVNDLLKEREEKQPSKKRTNLCGGSNF
jgi:hypothetical protein